MLLSCCSIILISVASFVHEVKAGSNDHLVGGTYDILTGNSATLECRFNLGGTWSWTWVRDGTSIATSTTIVPRDLRTRYQSARSSTGACQLSIKPVQIADNGTYACSIKDTSYHCEVELIARERAIIIDPPPNPEPPVIELDSSAPNSRLTLECSVRSPFNPDVDMVYTETKWVLKSSPAQFESVTNLIHIVPSSVTTRFSESRLITKLDATNTYTCSSYQPLPRNRPADANEYLTAPGSLSRVDSRDFLVIVNGAPWSPTLVTLDYNEVLRTVRRQLAAFSDAQLAEKPKILTVRRETITNSILGTQQKLFCVVESNPAARPSVEFRASNSNQFVNLGAAVPTHFSSIEALACAADDADPLCPAFTNLSDAARAMLNRLLSIYIRVYEFQFDAFSESQLGIYRCMASNEFGTASGDTLVSSDTTTTAPSTAAASATEAPVVTDEKAKIGAAIEETSKPVETASKAPRPDDSNKFVEAKTGAVTGIGKHTSAARALSVAEPISLAIICFITSQFLRLFSSR